MLTKETAEEKIMGLVVGHYDGWDEGDTGSYVLYGFVPIEGIGLPHGTVWFDLREGVAITYNDDGSEEARFDLATAIGLKR